LIARAAMALLAACLALGARAADFLPAAPQARVAIDSLPTVQAALARERAAAARGEALGRSPYGMELTVMPLTRHETRGTTYGEVESMLTKRLRLPGKARIDGQLAASGNELAATIVGDARHAGARLLLERYLAWVRAANAVRLAERQRALLEEEQRAIARRVELGDLPALDTQRAAAGTAAAKVGVEQARMERERARLALALQFPQLALPATAPEVPLPSTELPAEDATVARILESNHELEMAQLAARRQGYAAARADAEKHPDPTFGVRVLSEARGNEQAVGVVLSIPFAAGGTSATARAEHALTDAIDTEALGTAQLVNLEARQLVNALPVQIAAWQAAVHSADLTDAALSKVQRAWQLGEAGFADLTVARRAAFEARAAELALRVDVHALRARIEIDCHERWAYE
jgi:outer membrane protein, heavy metal efflux system